MNHPSLIYQWTNYALPLKNMNHLDLDLASHVKHEKSVRFHWMGSNEQAPRQMQNLLLLTTLSPLILIDVH